MADVTWRHDTFKLCEGERYSYGQAKVLAKLAAGTSQANYFFPLLTVKVLLRRGLIARNGVGIFLTAKGQEMVDAWVAAES